jgi:hypothetical protein
VASKITFETVWKIASSFPDVEVISNSRGTGVKVGGKLMACPAIHKSAEPHSLLLRIGLEQREALIAEAPETYYITGHYVNYPVVLVRLARVNREVLRDLLHAAWRFVSATKTSKKRRTALSY